MTPRKRFGLGLTIVAMSCAALAAVWLVRGGMPTQEVHAKSSSSSSLEFRQLDAALKTAFQNQDPFALIQRGESVRTFDSPAPADDAAHKTWRREKLQLWLAGLAGIQSSLDAKFDPQDRPSLNIAPMPKPGVTWTSGIAPEAIADDEVRNDYKARLTANREKAATHSFQSTLRRLEPRWKSEAKSHVEIEYTADDADRAEIQSLISSYVSGASEQQEIREFLLARDGAATFVAERN